VSGEGGSLLAVDQKSDLGDARKIGMKSSTNGKNGENFSLQAGGMAGYKSAGQVDDGELGAV
jgi:hypothetical protein